MPISRYDAVLQSFREGGANLRCSEVKRLLEELGFEVHDGKKGNHRTFTHDHVQEFHGGHYDCGHGKDSEVRRCYTRDIIRIIEKYETEIRAHLGESDD